MVQVSVIIPTYGEPKYLGKSIESVLNQTFDDLELIVVDDNNPHTNERKATESILNDFMALDSRVRYIKHERNRNGAAARNTGFAAAVGKYISFLDSDDEYLPERLQCCFDVMERSPLMVAGVYTGCEFRRRGNVYSTYVDVNPGNYLTETLACRFMFCTGSNIFVRKQVVDELCGFDESFQRHQDYEFLVRLFEKYSLAAIPEILVIKNNDNVNLPDVCKMIEIKKRYLEKYKSVIDSLGENDVKMIMHGNYINIAETAMSQNSFKIAGEYYSKARKFGGLSAKELARMCAYPIYNLIRRFR